MTLTTLALIAGASYLLLNKSSSIGKAKGYFTKKNIVKGDYKKTSVDDIKSRADILVIAIDDKYTLWINNPNIILKGRGIDVIDDNTVVVSERAFNIINSKYNVMFDL